MPTIDTDQLRSIKTFPSLVKYLRDELDWPIDPDNVDELTFEYTPEELGFDPKHAVKIREIKQLRPLVTGQPWGIFWVSFEKKKLPMVVLRRILGKLITKSRATADKATRPTWHLHDLLFISSYGEEEHRNISFAHFSESVDSQLPVLRVLGWDDQNSIMNLDRVANRLQGCLRWPETSGDLAMWRVRWSGAFTERYGEPIESAEALIARLAEVASSIRKRALDVLEAETDRGPLRKLFTAVRGLLIHDMSEDQFADMYAQTVSYGLLSASFSRPAGIHPENLVQLTKITNPFLESLLESLFSLNRGKFHFDVDEVGINDVLDLLRATNIEAIKAAFNDLNPAEDPVIRFYEGFLKAYDSEQRIKRGVFFTPRPVVSYIVRSVHELLQTEFGLEDGLASTATWANVAAQMERRRVLAQQEEGVVVPAFEIPEGVSPNDRFVLILDIATGTATFLNECIDVIERTMKTRWARELGKPDPVSPRAWRDPEILVRWRDYVPNHLLPRLYGFEIMMAPYAIAHVKLALKLGETGYQFRDGDRLHIYLTNSLEPPSNIADAKLADLFGPLAREAQEVNQVKRTKRFSVVIGNPPYSLWSQNLTRAARAIVDPYRSVAGEVIKERGALQFEKILQDDYVKFFRLSQVHIDQTGCGVLGLITNHAFTDNSTLRGMRYSLLSSFNRLLSLNLHGNSSKKERCQDGSVDENVFDIKQGVSIFHGVSSPASDGQARLCADLWGTREFKYATLVKSTVSKLPYRPFSSLPPFYLLKACDAGFAEEYERGSKLTEIFVHGSMGIVTARDHVAIAFGSASLLKVATEFRDSPLRDEAICTVLGIPPKKGWDVAKARQLIRAEKNLRQFITPIDYRPFDCREIFYHRSLVWGMSWPTMQHVLGKRNIGISTTRAIERGAFQHIFCSKRLIGHHFVSLKEVNYFYPLWLYPEDDSLAAPGDRQPNLKPGFLKSLAARLGIRKTGLHDLPCITPEDIFSYTYAVLHSPEYRRRYAEFLTRDFPRLPLTGNLGLFRALVGLGSQLVAIHVLESRKFDKPITEYVSGPSPEVERVSWCRNTVWIDMGQTSGFKGVSEAVWNFHIGGYQVCEKWLKDRKGRTLSADDRTHYQKIVVALSETIRVMAEIDRVIEKHGGWPDAFTSSAHDSDGYSAT